MYRERDILHENGRFWVLLLPKGQGFNVMVAGSTYSKTLETYPDVSLAIARVDYLAKRYETPGSLPRIRAFINYGRPLP